MSLNDVWRNLNKEIGFYTRETFEQIPAVPGVYAWFYPLRVQTKDPNKFIHEVNSVFYYDSSVKGKPHKEKEINFSWTKLNLKLDLNPKEPSLERFINIWNNALQDEKTFDRLRKILMKASIFMPPLYVGKTINLYLRCKQHSSGNDEGGFYGRFISFAKEYNLRINKVSDLIFVSIKTGDDISEDASSEEYEDLVEEMMKNLAKPVYSAK